MPQNEQIIYEVLLKNLDAFLRGSSKMNSAWQTQIRSAGTLNRAVARAGTAVTDNQRKIAEAANRASAILAKQASSQTKNQAGLVKAYNQTIRLIVKLQKEEEQAAAAQQNLREQMIKGSLSGFQFSKMLDSVISRIAASNVDVGKLSLGITVVSSALRLFGSILNFVGKAAQNLAQFGLKVLKSAFNALTAPIRNAIENLKQFVNRVLAVASGVLIRDVIFGIVRSIKELSDTVKESIVDLDVLRVRFETLIARQARASGQVENTADAFQLAGDWAKYLSGWIQKLSLQIPVDVTAIGNTLAFAQAMGFGVEQAQELTLSVSTFTTAMGLSSEVMERVILNFGQMKLQGKVTSTEMRDLARGAFFPLDDVLKQVQIDLGRTGESLATIKEEAAAGKISVDAFFNAFNKIVQRDFPEALERFSKTFEGLRIRFLNFVKVVVGQNVFGPLSERIRNLADQLLERLLSEDTLRKAQRLGYALGLAFDQIREAISRVIPAFAEVLKAFGITGSGTEILIKALAYLSAFIRVSADYIAKFLRWIAGIVPGVLEKTANLAKTWGANIVAFIAQGMSSAVHFIVNVMVGISRLLANWLAPGSPPKIAPNIDDWGAAAMNEYLKGFLNADFDILDAIQGPLKEILDIATITEAITDKEAQKIFLEVSKDLIKGIDTFNKTGEKSRKLFEKLRSIGGVLGKELANLLDLQFALADATKAAEEAQRRYNEAVEATQRARGNVHKLTREYNQLIRSGASAEAIQRKLAEVNAAEVGLDAAKKQEAAAKDANEEAQKQLDLIQQQVELQQRLLDALIELSRAQAEIVKPEKDTGGGGAEELPEAEPVPEVPPVPVPGGELAAPEFPDIDSIFADAEARVREFFQNLAKIVREKWDSIFGENGTLGSKFKELRKLWAIIWPQLVNLAKAAWFLLQQVVGAAVDTIKQKLEEMKESGVDVKTIFKVIGVVVGAVFLAIAGSVVGFVNGILTAIQTFAEGLDRIVEGIKSIGEGIDQFITGIKETVLGFVRGDMDRLKEGFSTLVEGIINIVGGGLDLLLGIFEATLGTVLAFVFGFVEGVIAFFVNLYKRLVGGSIVPDMMKDIYDTFSTWLTNTWNKVVEIFENIYNTIVQWLTDAYNWIVTKVQDLYNEWSQKFDDIWQKVEDIFSDVYDSVTTWIQDTYDDLKDVLEDIQTKWDEIWNSLKTTLETVWNTIRDNIVTPMITKFNEFIEVLESIAHWIGEVISAVATLNLDKLARLFGLVRSGGGGDSPDGGQFGGLFPSRYPFIAGEHGIPELIVPQTAMRVIPMARVAASDRYSGMMGGNQVYMNFGGVVIANDMDEQMFYSRVRQAVREAL